MVKVNKNKLPKKKPASMKVEESKPEEAPSRESKSKEESSDDFKSGSKSAPTKPEPKEKDFKLPVPSDDKDEMDLANFENGSTPASTKNGIIYMSNVPKHLKVKRMRKILKKFGKIGKIILQPSAKAKRNKRKRIHFYEGWVEFESNEIAKFVATALGNSRISKHKSSRFYDSLWRMKYLHPFTWVHLAERGNYPTEVSHAGLPRPQGDHLLPEQSRREQVPQEEGQEF
ncbi:uncharacterized protein [Drosophila suzukii]|uniref:Activator of basal transcription 1 n=1 Tax=Drosophila suzukii TaxID=28584 RepID=A0ABM4TVD9_DROSZ